MPMSEELKSVKVYFEERYRGLDHSVWKGCDTFVLHKDLSSHSILHVFNRANRSTKKVEKSLRDDGFEFRVAKGSVLAEIKEWRFIEPSDINRCRKLLQKIVDDPEFLRYYSTFQAVAPNGEELGKICDYVTIGQV